MNDENKAYDIKTIINNKSIWMRLLYMLLFAFLYSVAELVIIAVVVYQFLHVLLTGGDKDDKVASLGGQLSVYVYQIIQFQTFNTEERPFPMADWPEASVLAAEETKSKATPRKRTPAKKPAATKTTTKKAPTKKPASTRKPRAKKEDDKPSKDDLST